MNPDTTYLDHAGTTLYARSLIDAFHQDLTSNLYGNPHSVSPASDLSTRRVDRARHDVLEYFQASPDEFDVVFTANASAAIRLVGDCFRDQDFEYFYHKDVHTSVVGVREVSKASQCLTSNEEVENWIEAQKSTSCRDLQLFAYPAQSNLNGYRPPHSWCRKIRTACETTNSVQSTYVLLDAASYLTSGRLDLSDADDAPDFIAMSFYKIFGFPDLGALVVKKSAFSVMTHRKYFGGGTVDTVTVIGGAFHGSKRRNLHEFLEDGTLPFHNILALPHAISVHQKLYGSAADISQHTARTTAWLYDRLKSFRHYNDRPVVDIYQDPESEYGNTYTQGPIIAFNLRRPDGSFVGKSQLERLAINCGFQIRTGGVCNPGGITTMLHLDHWELMRNYTEGVRCGGDVDVVGAKPTGICRVSLGPMSTMSDVVRFSEFILHFFVETKERSFSLKQALNSETTKEVTPIKDCFGYAIAADDFDAHCVFDGKWCVVDSATGNVLQSRSMLSSLKVVVDLKSEQLLVAHESGNEITLSLWELPKAVNQPTEHLLVLYRSQRIDDWLSAQLGLPCGLGYYSSDSSRSDEATTCVVSNCGGKFESKAKLEEHYLQHAEGFMNTYQFGRTQNRMRLERWRSIFRRKSAQQIDCALSSVQSQSSLMFKSTDSLRSKKSNLKSFLLTRVDFMSGSRMAAKEADSENKDSQRRRSCNGTLTIVSAKVTNRV